MITVTIQTSDRNILKTTEFEYKVNSITWLLLNDFIPQREGVWKHLYEETIATVSSSSESSNIPLSILSSEQSVDVYSRY